MPFTGVWTQLPRIPPPDTVFKDHSPHALSFLNFILLKVFMGETPIVGRSLEMLIKRFMHDYPSASYHLTKRSAAIRSIYQSNMLRMHIGIATTSVLSLFVR